MRTSQLALLSSASLSLSLAAPSPPGANEPQQPAKRQDFSEILQLASAADIALPTDPALLLSIAPVAAQLASYLPTAPVLSVLETAVPSGFLSAVVHDPSYAVSFETAFAAGHSPSWFLALPTGVKEYLHSYNGLGGVATEVGSVESIIASATKAASASASAEKGMATATATVTTPLATQTEVGSLKSGLIPTTLSETTGVVAGTTGSGAQSTVTDATGATVTSSVSAGASPAGSPTTTASTAGAPRETGMLAAGVAMAAGMLGFAMAL